MKIEITQDPDNDTEVVLKFNQDEAVCTAKFLNGLKEKSDGKAIFSRA